MRSRPYYSPPIRCGEWWGCQEWLVRSTPPDDGAEDVDVPDFFDAVAASLPGAPAAFGTKRVVTSATGSVQVLPVENDHAYAVRLPFVTFCEATVDPDEWRWTEPESHVPVLLVGLRGGEPVALVAPFRLQPHDRERLAIAA